MRRTVHLSAEEVTLLNSALTKWAQSADLVEDEEWDTFDELVGKLQEVV